MSKKLEKTRSTVKVNDDTAFLVAEMHGVSKRYVNMVIEGTRVNESILTSYMQIKEGKTILIEAVKKAVPFN